MTEYVHVARSALAAAAGRKLGFAPADWLHLAESLWLHRGPARRRLVALSPLRSRPSGARRPGACRIPVRAPPRVRRRPHRRDRRHRALHAAKGPTAARRRLLLLARAFDDRAVPRRRHHVRGGGRQGRAARAQERGRPDRRHGFRHVPVDHRHPQPARAPRHSRRVEEGEGGNPRSQASRGAPRQARPHEPPVRGPVAEDAESQLADVPAGTPVRPGVRHRLRSRACSR